MTQSTSGNLGKSFVKDILVPGLSQKLPENNVIVDLLVVIARFVLATDLSPNTVGLWLLEEGEWLAFAFYFLDQFVI